MQKTKRFTRKSIFIMLFVALAVVAAVVVFARPTTSDAAETPALQTAKVRMGDLVVTASGAGTIVPSAQMELGFRASGVLTELNVAVGDGVEAAQVLARLEENIQAEADFQALFTPLGVAQAEGAVAAAQVALDDAPETLMYLISPDVYYYEVKLAEAQTLLDSLNADPAATDDARAEAQKNLDQAAINLTAAQSRYIYEYLPAYFTYTWVDEETREIMTAVIPPTDADITLARTNIESAKVNLQDALAALEIVKAGPEALTAPLTALGPQMAKLEQARLAVEATRLSAPFDGTVISLDAIIGQAVGTSPIMTIATTEKLMVRFYLDETDIDKVAVGNRVTFMFDAYPDQPVDGEVVIVEPSLQVVDGTPVIVVWASLPTETGLNLLSGMTVDAEVIAGESLQTLIVPVQALRELAPGSYAVFLVGAGGQLTMTPVSVGLRDFANAEILSGVKVGDVVSTGTVETK
ncbi:MAG: efflux RND transporter periplasmic adaptor subunit [Chloroflexi bacterium]|nr:efflux RND transporter periplasmic adaptor subunit [Chloroflexota bacterium]